MNARIGSSWNVSSLFRSHLTASTPFTYLTSLGLMVLPLSGCLQESSLSSAETSVAAAELPTVQESPRVSEGPVDPFGDADAEEAMAEADSQSISTAPAKKVSKEIEVPANLKPSPATAEIIKLANAGVDQLVMLSFVTNSLGTFNLRAEEIIYLNDIGVPSAVVTAMIQRDHLLQATPSNLTMAPPEAEPPLPPVYPPDNVSDFAAPVADSYASDNYAMPVEPEPAVADDSAYYDALAPYGTWVDVDGIGRCWQPTVMIVNPGWRPYFDCGRWVYSDCGWYWMSDYSWGWAPFHYGRWFQHAQLGWCWRPDHVWGPSWVCWRHDNDYCGWAPLPPGARFVAGVGLTFRGRPVRPGFSFGLAANHFPFVHFSHFLDRDLPRHTVRHDDAIRIFDRTIASTGIAAHNHTVVNNGVPRDHVAAATHVAIRPAVLRDVTPPDGLSIRERFERNGRTLAVYRPEAQQRPLRSPTFARETQRPANNSVGNSIVPGRTQLARVQPQSPQMASPTLPTARGTDSRLGPVQPLILHGAGRPNQSATATTGIAQNTRRGVPLNSVVVIGQNRDSRVSSTQPNTRPSWNSQYRPTSSSSRNMLHSSSQNAWRNDETQSDILRQPQQSPPQSTWWAAQPQPPSTGARQQLSRNREVPTRGGGGWNGSVESPRYNSMPTHAVERTRSVPIESHQSRPAPVESHVTHSAPAQTHSAPAVEHSSHSAPASAPAPAASSSSSSHSSSSSSSGRGR